MNVEYINPFIEASQSVFQMVTGENPGLGKVYLKNSPYSSDSVAIIVGITGKIRGQVVFSLSKNTAMGVASAMMCGMPVSELDEMAKSAISELANMILGNTATLLGSKGINIEITPPSMLIGDNIMISPTKMKTVCVPLLMSGDKKIEIDISIEEN